ncbi:MAG: YggS family pyridoxal phosphate-dependent enzyme [Tannerella sp.]|nr:YggS family pyridoxal phosphate-dependent enzyme [Tannerella sp.]
MDVKRNIRAICSSLPEGVKLVAVSKFHPVETIKEVYGAGQRIFGESRVQELIAKQPLLPEDIEWHFIGTLQTNKVKYIAPFISMIESVDTFRLLQEINRQAEKFNRVIRALIEVHIAEEGSKHGFSIDECKSLFTQTTLKQFPSIRVCGLMGMATFTDDTDQVRREFGILRNLFNEIKSIPDTDKEIFTELSMGMSDDYKVAIEEGSTIVRIGTGIFGTREY